MMDWQLRVIKEKEELDVRVAKLEAYVNNIEFTRLYLVDSKDLVIQLDLMKRYSGVLASRISRFV